MISVLGILVFIFGVGSALIEQLSVSLRFRRIWRGVLFAVTALFLMALWWIPPS